MFAYAFPSSSRKFRNRWASTGLFAALPMQKKSFWTTPFESGPQNESTSGLTPFGM